MMRFQIPYVFLFFICMSCQTKNKKSTPSPEIPLAEQWGKLEEHVKPCPTLIRDHLRDTHLGYVCGEIEVPLFHDKETNFRKLHLQFIYVKPDSGDVKTPLVMSQGGPGGSSIELFLGSIPSWETIIRKYGLLIFEYRGTDFSEPNMKCKFKDIKEKSENPKFRMQMKECFEYWNAKFDLSAINTKQVAHDLDLITRKIGAKTFHFYGVSYGTLIGQYLARLHPERVESLILDGVAPYKVDWNVFMEDSFYSSLKKLEQHCVEDNFCKTMYKQKSDIVSDFKNAKEAIKKQVRHQEDVGEDDFTRFILESSYYGGTTSNALYKFIKNWKDSNYLKEVIIRNLEFENEINVVYYSVYCNERALESGEFRLTSEDEKKERDTYREVCKIWLPDAKTSLRDLKLSEQAKKIPTLLLSGELDPITPSYYADKVEKEFSNTWSYVAEYVGHGAFFATNCMSDKVTAFLENRNALARKGQCDLKVSFQSDVSNDPTLISPSDLDGFTLSGWKTQSHSLESPHGDLELYSYADTGAKYANDYFWLYRENKNLMQNSVHQEVLKHNKKIWTILWSNRDQSSNENIFFAFLRAPNAMGIGFFFSGKPGKIKDLEEFKNEIFIPVYDSLKKVKELEQML